MTPSRTLRVVLDTNFLMLPLRFGVDLRSEIGRVLLASFTLATTPAVVDELKRLRTQVRPAEVKDVDFALALTERIDKVDDTLREGEEVDDQLLRIGGDGYIVATTDAELRKRLRARSIPVIFLRQSRYLAVEGLI